MYMTAQHIVTTYTGSFTAFVRDRIFVPLNMTSSTYLYSEAVETGKATQNWGETGRLIPWWFKDDTAELIAGAGGVISSAQDMVRESDTRYRSVLNLMFARRAGCKCCSMAGLTP